MRKLGEAILWCLAVALALVAMLLMAVAFERPLYGASPKDIYEKHKRSIVLVFAVDKEQKEFSAGGGVVISLNTVITMNHIVPDGWNVFVVFYDGEKFEASVSSRDEHNDLMKLGIQHDDAVRLMRPIRLDISPPDVGETLYFIGHPAGTLYSFAQGYSMFPSERVMAQYNDRRVLQISMTATSGSSGGAVLDEQGELRGLASMLSPDGSMLYATPSRMVCNLVKCKEKP